MEQQSQTINKKLLIVEDDPGLQKQLKWCFEGMQVFVADNREEAMNIINNEKPSVVITDLGLPPDPGGSTEGFALLEEIVVLDDEIKVIVITGRDEKENSVRAIGSGAYDFYQKPIDIETLKFVVDRAFKLDDLERENRELLKSQEMTWGEGMIGSGDRMAQITKTASRVAATSANLLILGESGTGKGMLAKSIHALSDRSENKLVTINCTSIPESLLESELFGYEKGAFTGAISQKIGKIEYANKGTLFLDEIGDMPMSLQAKMLNVLQERTIVRLGGNKEIPLDIRVLCATHQNIKKRIEEGLFREDLYYRISEIDLEMPPLRERLDDIMVLANSFLQRFASQQGRQIKKFSQAAVVAIRSYNWPGNIRELENKVKRAVVMCEKSVIGPDDMELAESAGGFEPVLLQDVRARAESDAIIQTLANSKNISEAAKSLGVTRPTLYNLINKYKLESYLAANQ